MSEMIIILNSILIGFLILVSIILFLVWLDVYISNKIHKSYHKGYNQANDDKIKYYKVLKELTDDYNNILLTLEKYTFRITEYVLLNDLKVKLKTFRIRD